MEDKKFFLVVGDARKQEKSLSKDKAITLYLPDETFGAEHIETLHSLDKFISWCARHHLADDMSPRRARCVIDAIESAAYEIASSVHYTPLADVSPLGDMVRRVDLRRSLYQPADSVVGWGFWGCDALSITYKIFYTDDAAQQFLDKLDLVDAYPVYKSSYERGLAAKAYADDKTLKKITDRYTDTHKNFDQKVNESVRLYEEIEKEFDEAQRLVKEMFTPEGDRLAKLRVEATAIMCQDEKKIPTLEKAKSDLLADRRRERNVIKDELEEAKAQAGFMCEAQKIKKLIDGLRKSRPYLSSVA